MKICIKHSLFKTRPITKPLFYRAKHLIEALGVFRITLRQSHKKGTSPPPTELGSHMMGRPTAKIESIPESLYVAV